MRFKVGIFVLVVTLFAGALHGYGQGMMRTIKVGRYGHPFDSTYVWHPQQIYIVWPDLQLEFLLPYEQESSGVANLLFRDLESGEIRLLDSVMDNLDYGKSYSPIKDIKHARRADRIKPGNYDVVLLYNNGKYIVYNNLTIVDGVKMSVDMTQVSVQPSDSDSQGWLKHRKFTDIIGVRLVESESAETLPYKIAGYVFNHVGYANEHAAFYQPAPANESYFNQPVSGVSTDGYFELNVAEEDVTYTFNLGSSISSYDLDVKANTWLFIIVEKQPLRKAENIKFMKDLHGYERKFAVDTTYLWHPEQFCIMYPDMRIDFKFPYEKEKSGVSNLLFKDRESGKISLLDYFTEETRGNHTYITRHFTSFKLGSYDAILLYNNGRYIVQENLTFEKGVKIAIDMTKLTVRKADSDSYKWLKLRKFTDIAGHRTIWSDYDMSSLRKNYGYIFDSKNGEGLYGTTVRFQSDVKKQSISSADGYFEFGYEEGDIGSTLIVSNVGLEDIDFKLSTNSGYFIVMERIPPVVIPKIIGEGSVLQQQ